MPRPKPPRYVLASLLISIGGFSNGYDTGSIGAVLDMAQFQNSIGHLSAFMYGFTVSIMMLAGVLPSLISGYLSDNYGRLRVILLGGIIFGFGALLQSTAFRLHHFLVGRVFAGIGQGIFLGNMSVYIIEIAPAKWRGILAGLPQLFITAGVCGGYFTCYGSVAIKSSMAWRLPLVMQCALAVAIISTCVLLPESPRWLSLRGKRAETLRALQRLQFPIEEAERDFMLLENQETSLSGVRVVLLLFTRAYRSRTILGLFVLGMVQLSGIDGILYYAPTLFSQAGLKSQTASFLASGVSSILMLAISIPSFLLADKWGRRTSAITGGILLSACMLLIGSLYASGVVSQSSAARWIVIVTVFGFGLSYCATWGIVGKIYASEIQPSNTRAAASCVAQALAFFINWIVLLITPILLAKSSFGVYFLFGGLALATVATLSVWMPETRKRSLEDIQSSFHQNVPGFSRWAANMSPWRRACGRSNDAQGQGVALRSFDHVMGRANGLDRRVFATSGEEQGPR